MKCFSPHDRLLAALLLAVLAGGCGGGISGSSNGGGEPGPTTDKLLIGYVMEQLPSKVTWSVPDALWADELQEPEDGRDNPAQRLSGEIVDIADLHIKFGIVQLYADRAWQGIQQYCIDVQKGDDCDLTGSNISFMYSAEMAVWESRLRERLAPTRSDSDQNVATNWSFSDAEDTVSVTSVQSAALAKIDSEITISAGTYRQLTDSEYSHEVALSLPELEVEGHYYTLQWNNDKDKVRATVDAYEGGESFHYQSTLRNSFALSNAVQHLVFSRYENGIQREIQLNQRQSVDNDAEAVEVFVDAVMAAIDGSRRSYMVSQGRIRERGGYLFSKITDVNMNQDYNIMLQRETFGAGEYSYSNCDLLASSEQCGSEQHWQLVKGEDPKESDEYISTDQLEDLKVASGQFVLTLRNVMTEADSYLFLKRGGFSVESTPNGERAVNPIVGEFVSPPTAAGSWVVAPDDVAKDRNILSPLMLCRVLPSPGEDIVKVGAFCFGGADEIADAIVLSEFYGDDGGYRVHWEAAAEIVVGNCVSQGKCLQ